MIKLNLLAVFCCFLLVFSPLAFASNQKLNWELSLIVITAVSAIGAVWMVKRKDYEARLVKILVAGVYFWIFTFIQLAIFAVVYTSYF